MDHDQAVTRRTLLAQSVRHLQAAGVANARRNAEWILCEVLKCGRAQLFAYHDHAVLPDDRAAVEAMVRRRARHEPLQYILGHASFYGLQLRVTPAVLIPRPETEQVVEEALRLLDGQAAPRVLDVGTGSGCIALALKHERPDAVVYACDVSLAALAVAEENATEHGLDVTFVHADILDFSSIQQLPSELDLVISNPPYVPDEEAEQLPQEVRDYEPEQALFTGEDALCYYRAIIVRAPVLLKPGGGLVFETHADHANAVGDLLRCCGFAGVQVWRDLTGRLRIATGKHTGAD